MSDWNVWLSEIRLPAVHGRPAPHRPLLLLWLLDRAARRELNAHPYRDFEPWFRRAMAAIEWPGATSDACLPFWHLQTTPFWRVRDADKMPRRTGHARPSRSTLRSLNAIGEVEPDAWAALTGENDLIAELRSLVRSKHLVDYPLGALDSLDL